MCTSRLWCVHSWKPEKSSEVLRGVGGIHYVKTSVCLLASVGTPLPGRPEPGSRQHSRNVGRKIQAPLESQVPGSFPN